MLGVSCIRDVAISRNSDGETEFEMLFSLYQHIQLSIDVLAGKSCPESNL